MAKNIKKNKIDNVNHKYMFKNKIYVLLDIKAV